MIDNLQQFANGEKTTHKFIYILDDFASIDYIQTYWAQILKTVFTYNGKYNNQNLIIDQGMSIEHGKFFLLVQVDLTKKQFSILCDKSYQ